MALSGTLVKQISIKSDGNKFLDLFRYRPYLVSDMSPLNVKGFDIVGGEWGSVGSVTTWKRFQDGSDVTDKVVIEAADMGVLVFKVMDGTLMDLYKSFFWTINVDTNGANNSVTWTSTYEKLNESVEDPNTSMEFWLNVTKDIDTKLLN